MVPETLDESLSKMIEKQVQAPLSITQSGDEEMRPNKIHYHYLSVRVANKPTDTPLSEDEAKLLTDVIKSVQERIPSARIDRTGNGVLVVVRVSDASEDFEREFEKFRNEADSKLSTEIGEAFEKQEKHPLLSGTISLFPRPILRCFAAAAPRDRGH